MQITTLNKIINLLLVGTWVTLAIVWCILTRTWGIDKSRIKEVAEIFGSPVVVLVVTLFLLSATVFVGMIVNALSTLILKPFLKKAITHQAIMRLTRNKKDWEDHNFFVNEFNRHFRRSERYGHVATEEPDNQSLACALFFQTANKENIDWLIQHYSLSILAMDYVFVLLWLPILVVFMPLTIWYQAGFILLIIICTYALISTTIDRYLYSYEVVYRHGIIVLCQKTSEERSVRELIS